MNRIDERRPFPRPAVFAALAIVAQLLFMQAAGAAAAQSPQPQQPLAAPVSPPPSQSRGGEPQSPPLPEQVGDSLVAHQRYQAAIEAYKKAPLNSADVWNKMGIAYQMMYNLQDAARCYQQSLKLNPKNASVLNNLGTIYDSLRRYGDAERLYRRALKLDPQSALIRKNLGTALIAEHKLKQGWENYQAALAIDPHIFENNSGPRVENPGSLQARGAMNYYMARGCVRAGQNDRAIDYLRLALNEGYTNPKKLITDSDFAAIRDLPAFRKLLAEQSTP